METLEQKKKLSHNIERGAQFGTNTHIFFIACYSQLIFKV